MVKFKHEFVIKKFKMADRKYLKNSSKNRLFDPKNLKNDIQHHILHLPPPPPLTLRGGYVCDKIKRSRRKKLMIIINKPMFSKYLQMLPPLTLSIPSPFFLRRQTVKLIKPIPQKTPNMRYYGI